MLRTLILKLACIDPEDRQWIINELSDAERKTVLSLLDEVHQLGLTRDKKFVRNFLHDMATIPEALPSSLDFIAEPPNQNHMNGFWQELFEANRATHESQENLTGKNKEAENPTEIPIGIAQCLINIAEGRE